MEVTITELADNVEMAVPAWCIVCLSVQYWMKCFYQILTCAFTIERQSAIVNPYVARQKLTHTRISKVSM